MNESSYCEFGDDEPNTDTPRCKEIATATLSDGKEPPKVFRLCEYHCVLAKIGALGMGYLIVDSQP